MPLDSPLQLLIGPLEQLNVQQKAAAHLFNCMNVAGVAAALQVVLVQQPIKKLFCIHVFPDPYIIWADLYIYHFVLSVKTYLGDRIHS